MTNFQHADISLAAGQDDSGPAAPVTRRAILGGVVVGGAAITAGAVTGGPVGGGPAAAAPAAGDRDDHGQVRPGGRRLLCEPYLLDPRADAVYVVWHTEEHGTHQVVLVGRAVAGMSEPDAIEAATGDRRSGPGWRRVTAATTRLTRTREDAASAVPGRSYSAVLDRHVYRHLADVDRLAAGRTPYRVVSVDHRRRATVTAAYRLAPAVARNKPVQLLLTSDHQLKNMTPANLEQVAATVGVELDGVLVAGDLVNVPDRASEWFDSATGLAFFAGLTGRAEKALAGRTYRGAPLVQHAPIFPAIGNHEVMGRWSDTAGLDSQFNDPQPRAVAEELWRRDRPAGEDRAAWLAERSWDVTTYEEIFPYPRSGAGGPRWWSRSVGDVFLVSLFVTQIWRSPASGVRGKFQEAPADLARPENWGYGQHIFEPIKRGSAQYAWLERELASPAARRARYRVVMYHHPGHGLGDNSAPPFTDPVQTIHRDAAGAVTAVTYDYPLADDYILRDLEPLFSAAGVHLVHNGHSHLWNRFRNDRGVNWLETSNVGNSYGAYDVSSGASRNLPADPDHVLQGDPGGLTPIVPTVAPLTDAAGRPLPYVASNDITVFSVLDSAAGVVRSYRYDTRQPGTDAVLFDELPLR
ncbi:metallophosphoesterase [Solwaraspora sp. WMMD1047]|uniref:metallophosphoesterase family protein n=1 Tax=Solwaraspora sp. WMMD1047 TaxID=3016102 RepID=UPI002416A9F8|nr:metallophosphoesterase [Solwaraspora sp. WMMD1047]MDG4831528.1 metallophosphoesterase [Solwaraspora sp. WMMD1047]